MLEHCVNISNIIEVFFYNAFCQQINTFEVFCLNACYVILVNILFHTFLCL